MAQAPTVVGAGNVGRMPDAGPALGRGSTLGRYLILDFLGVGGMGVVYSAYDPGLDRKVAIKLLRPTTNAHGGTTAGRSRLLREAQALARLSHPNVIAVHDVGTFEDQVFVAMEYAEGQTLSAWLREEPRSVREIVAAFLEAGRGLAAAHAAGLVHRDFKPANVLFGNGRARVLDFGLACTDVSRESGERVVALEDLPPALPLPPPLTGDSTQDPSLNALGTPLTMTGTLMGTPAYMAPEQMAGRPVDARTDQFSF
jgi:serine/threonine protein kinase